VTGCSTLYDPAIDLSPSSAKESLVVMAMGDSSIRIANLARLAVASMIIQLPIACYCLKQEWAVHSLFFRRSLRHKPRLIGESSSSSSLRRHHCCCSLVEISRDRDIWCPTRLEAVYKCSMWIYLDYDLLMISRRSLPWQDMCKAIEPMTQSSAMSPSMAIAEEVDAVYVY